MARRLENWLRAYLDYTRNLEAPGSMHFWSGVATVAAALQGKCWIDMGFFKWKPNFFIIFVAPPGTATKSTTIRVGQDLLRDVDGVHFGPKSLTWQYLTDTLADATQQFEDPRSSELITTSSVTCVASELGTFLDPKNTYMIDMLVDLWDGQDVSWTRGTRGEGTVEVPNPWINFIGACTPSWIADSFPEYAIGGGFVSRSIFVYAEHKRNIIAYPKFEQDEEDPQLKEDLIHDLQQMSRMVGEFPLTDEALAWGREWYRELWENRPSHLNNERMAGYVARKQTHIHKLAMVLSAAKRTDQMIHKEDLETANDFMYSIEQTMQKVFSQVTDNPHARYAAAVVRTAKRFVSASKTRVWKELFHMMAWEDFERAMTSCLNAGYIELKQVGNEVYVIYKGEPDPEQPGDATESL